MTYVIERASDRRDWQPVSKPFRNPRNADSLLRRFRAKASVALGERFRLTPQEVAQ